MRSAIEMVGKKFGHLEVLRESERSVPREKAYIVKCLVCGNESDMLGGNIRRHSINESVMGCKACFKANKIHGLWDHPAYNVWEGMMRRCYSEKHSQFRNYGGRGISVCDEWSKSPTKFIDWLIENGWEKGLEIDREDNSLGYSPANCRVTTRIINCNNKRTNRHVVLNGEKTTIAMASRITGILKTTIRERLNRGWSDWEACNVDPQVSFGRHNR